MIMESNSTHRFTTFHNKLGNVGAYYRVPEERVLPPETFYRSLPLNIKQRGLLNRQITTRQRKSFMTNGKRIRALVIDDEPLARAIVRESLDTGLLTALVGECENSREAIKAIEALSPDVIFLKILQLLEELRARPQYIERLAIKAEGRIFLLDVDDIHYIQAEGNYIAVHNGQKEYLLRETITSLEARLDPKKFLRVHRSAIVKIDKIRELQPWFHGEFRIILDGGKQLMLSRNYRARLQKAIGNAL